MHTDISFSDSVVQFIALVEESIMSQEISFPLPKALCTTLHIHLTFLETTAMVFLTTTSTAESQGVTKPMGSFVYSMPDVS